MVNLIDYLRDVAVTECQLYAQAELDCRLEKKIRQLGRARRFEKPVKRESSTKTELIAAVLIGSLAIFALIILFIGGVQDGFDYVMETAGGMLLLFIGALILALILFHKHRKEVEEIERINRANLAEYHRNINGDKIRVQNELAMKQRLLAQQNQVRAAIRHTQAARQSLYALNIIHPDYRDIVPATSFYDYFEKGICTEFTGFGGAYARYEEDLRFARIEGKLDVIIHKLDEILANQKTLASLLRESNATLRRIEAKNDAMAKNIEQIKENSELTAYNTRCAAQSLSVMEHIEFYRAMKYE